MIVQHELSAERLAEELTGLIERPDEISRMEEASRQLGRSDSAERAVDLAMSVVRGSRSGAGGQGVSGVCI
jgi:UDP-N-acetylglucosamine:LPS N-acetylglucosamine transferase